MEAYEIDVSIWKYKMLLNVWPYCTVILNLLLIQSNIFDKIGIHPKSLESHFLTSRMIEWRWEL